MSGKVALEGMKIVFNVLKNNRKGFDSLLLKQTELVDASPGRCIVLLKVQEEHLNGHGTLHGGVGATLVDVVSTLALFDGSEDFEMKKFGVSVDLNLTYMSAAKLGDEVLVDGKVIKSGKKLAFLECELRHRETDKVILKGSHTKFVG